MDISPLFGLRLQTPRLELRIPQHGTQLGRLGDRSREVAKGLVHLREPARVLRRAEERLGVDAMRNRH